MGFFDNISHHLAVAREALVWEKENEAGRKARGDLKRHELEFMPAALEITESPAPPLGRLVMSAISVFFVIAAAWAWISEVDIIAVAQGKIVPTKDVQLIQPVETGSVRAIHVRDGQRVKSGDVLIELDPTGADADRERLAQDLIVAEVESARLNALLTEQPRANYRPPQGAPAHLVAQQRSLLESQLIELEATRASLLGDINKSKAEGRTVEASIARLNRKLLTVRDRHASSKQLFDQGLMPKMKFGEFEEELGEAEGQLDEFTSRLTEIQATVNSAQAKLRQAEAEHRRDAHSQLAEVMKTISGIEQELRKAQQRNRLQTLNAPVDGIVQALAVHTVGGVVTPAQELMRIVPIGTRLEIEAMILNKDIGSVEMEQEAILKVESFPFTKYGTIDGKVRHLSADAVQDEKLGLIFPARVTMAKSTMWIDGREVQLTPGMSVTTEIKTGKRKVIDFILAPLKRYQDESLRER